MPTSSVNIAIAAGSSVSSSCDRTGRTRGSAVTCGRPSMASSGCRGRWAPGGPPCGAAPGRGGPRRRAVEGRRGRRGGGAGGRPPVGGEPVPQRADGGGRADDRGASPAGPAGPLGERLGRVVLGARQGERDEIRAGQ